MSNFDDLFNCFEEQTDDTTNDPVVNAMPVLVEIITSTPKTTATKRSADNNGDCIMVEEDAVAEPPKRTKPTESILDDIR